MKNMLGARKHSNISPFMILRTVKNFRRFHRLNKELARCARKYYVEKSNRSFKVEKKTFDEEDFKI